MRSVIRFSASVLLVLAACGCGHPAPTVAVVEHGASVDRPAAVETSPEPAAQDAPPTAEPAYDARLTGYAYPYPVQMFPVETHEGTLEMAYMDVAPSPTSNGRVVVLLHGKNFSGAYWRRSIAALAGRGFRVVVPDQIGFGKSDKPASFQFTFQALAGHTKALLDHLGIDRACVVGHSMGGMLAVRFALMYPAAVEKLALICPIGLEDWKLVAPYVPVEELCAREMKRKPDSVKSYMLGSFFHGEWKPEYDELTEIQRGWMNGPDRARVAYVSALTTDMCFTQPVLYELDKVPQPTLLVVGLADRTALGKRDVPSKVRRTMGDYPALGKAAAQAIVGSQLVELAGVGHVPQYEAFDRYWAALSAFLK